MVLVDQLFANEAFAVQYLDDVIRVWYVRFDAKNIVNVCKVHVPSDNLSLCIQDWLYFLHVSMVQICLENQHMFIFLKLRLHDE